MTKEKSPYAERAEYATYTKDGITYVPHYRNPSVYVGPGYPEHTQQRYSEAELEAAGATRKTEFLWTRCNYGTVTDKDL